MRFVIATADYSGLGFAVRIQDEGHEAILATNPPNATGNDPEWLRRYDLVGHDMVAKARLASLMERRNDLRDAYWIWDHNHSVPENEQLRREGFKVLGGGEYSYRMEHDRAACLEHASVYGLLAPPSVRFDNTADAMPCPADLSIYAFFPALDNGAAQVCQGGMGYNSFNGHGQVNALSAVTH
jgi:hypothetical protein